MVEQMLDRPRTRLLSEGSRGILPVIAAVAILLIMAGAAIILLLGGSVSIQFNLP
jgi:hypothetical protein